MPSDQNLQLIMHDVIRWKPTNLQLFQDSPTSMSFNQAALQ